MRSRTFFLFLLAAVVLLAGGYRNGYLAISPNNTQWQTYIEGGVVNPDKSPGALGDHDMFRFSRPPHSNDLHLFVNQGELTTRAIRLGDPVAGPPPCGDREAGTFSTAPTNPKGKRRVPVYCDGEQWLILQAPTPLGRY